MDTTPQQATPLTQRSPILHLGRWLFRPKTLGLILCTVLTFATLVALFYAEEYWRGRRAWERYAAEVTAKGGRLDWEANLPPKAPDDQNFAMTPFLTPLYDFLPGTQTWRDTNAYGRVSERVGSPNELAKTMGFRLDADQHGRWEKGERTDLMALLGTNRLHERVLGGAPQPAHLWVAPKLSPIDHDRSPPSTTNAASAVPRPATQEQAATLLLGIFKQTLDPVFDELRTASRRPDCRFNIHYEAAPVVGILLPHLAIIKGLVIKLSWRASAGLVLGKTDQAFDDLKLGLYLSDTVRQEPFLISHLVGLASRWFPTQVIWEGLSRHQWSDAQLEQLQTWLAKEDCTHDGRQALLHERAGAVRLATQLRTNAGGAFASVMADDPQSAGLPHHLFPKGWFYFEQLNLCRAYDRQLSLFEAWQSRKQDTQTLFAALAQEEMQLSKGSRTPWMLWKHRFFENTLTPEKDKLWQRSFQAQVRNDLARVACALERYYLAKGSYPENLDAVVPTYLPQLPLDIMSGKPLVFRRETPSSFTLYSVGQNLVDDGGKVVLGKNGFVQFAEGDWVWRQPGK